MHFKLSFVLLDCSKMVFFNVVVDVSSKRENFKEVLLRVELTSKKYFSCLGMLKINGGIRDFRGYPEITNKLWFLSDMLRNTYTG